MLACRGNPPGSTDQVEFAGRTMGTFYRVLVRPAPADSDERERVRAAIASALESVNDTMSTYKPESELSQFNRHADETPFPVSADTLAVFVLAERVSRESRGAFDVTVGPIVNAFGFGPDERRGDGPSDEELALLRERVGFEKVEVDEAGCRLRKRDPRVNCDLSAIAKGYGVDKAAEALEAAGYSDYMVEVGGEVRTRGQNASGEPWRIAIEQPDVAGRAIHLVVPLSGLSMATSGDYRNYYEVDGKRISHTIDARTGRPISHNLASVSVIHHECASADAYATALMVLGPEEGLALAEKLNLSALFLVRVGPDRFDERASTAFADYMESVGNTAAAR